MHSARIEVAKLILIGTRITYQATGDAGCHVIINNCVSCFHFTTPYDGVAASLSRYYACLSHTRLCCAVLCCAVLYCAVRCGAVRCGAVRCGACLLYTSPSPRDRQKSRMPSSA